jgi:dynactin complex subunit
LLYEDCGLKHNQHVGCIRYVGKILNNPKAGDDIWLGMEWDLDKMQGGPGLHNGTVDGITYFKPELNFGEKTCSFLRMNKVEVGGITIMEAI